MGKSLKEAKRLQRERDDKRLGTNPELRRLDRILCDEAEVRNKERKLLGKVVSSKVIKRGGLSKERNKEIQALFKKGKPLPYLGKDIAAEKALRDAAVKELEEALQKIEEARAAGVTTHDKGQDSSLQMQELKPALPAEEHDMQIEEVRAAGVTTHDEGQDSPLQMQELKPALPEAPYPVIKHDAQIEKPKPENATQDKWEGIALPLR